MTLQNNIKKLLTFYRDSKRLDKDYTLTLRSVSRKDAANPSLRNNKLEPFITVAVRTPNLATRCRSQYEHCLLYLRVNMKCN
jgi:hypothetical protein